MLRETEVPRPEPGISQVLVRVHAAGVNPTDWSHRAFPIFLGPPPFTLGWDVSGVVEATGFGVTLFQPGDEVFGMLPYPGGVGSHAEYVTAPTRAFARKPENVDHVQAAALPLAALTAWQALNDRPPGFAFACAIMSARVLNGESARTKGYWATRPAARSA